jgi:UDP-glucose 4-epimerase
MANILVTGGAGFVGSHLCAALTAAGHTAVVIDDLSNGRRENIAAGTEAVIADLSEPGWMSTLRGRTFDAVLHCAAQASNALSFRDPELDYRANQLATWRVLQFCRDEGIRRLIFTSSMSVYGEPPVLPTPSDEVPRPLTYYAAHKAVAESYVRYARDLDWTIFRLYTTYGMGQNLANLNQGLVKIYLGYVLRGEPVTVHGSGERVRDIVHVSDVVRAIMLALPAPASFGRCYNLGSGQTLTVSQIIGRILAAAGKPADYPVVYGPADIGDPRKTHADVSAAARDFGWRPEVSPEAGIDMTVGQHLAARSASEGGAQ